MHIFGLTTLNSGTGNISVDGRVTSAATAGNKDGVVIGEGSSSKVTLTASGSGGISLYGDASSIGNVLSGARYDGVFISQGALIQTAAGDIQIIGKGGGGNLYVSDQNHGVRLESLNTSILSSSGNILLGGVAGGGGGGAAPSPGGGGTPSGGALDGGGRLPRPPGRSSACRRTRHQDRRRANA